MTLYNVRTSVVALIESESPERAIRLLHRQLESKGFQPYVDPGVTDPDAFESEPLD